MKLYICIKGLEPVPEFQPAPRYDAYPAPVSVCRLEIFVEKRYRTRIAFLADNTRILDLDSSSFFGDLPNDHQDALNDFFGSKPRNNRRFFVFSCDEGIGDRADDRADMPGQDKTINLNVRRIEQGIQRRRYQLVGRINSKVFCSRKFRMGKGARDKRRGGFEPRCKENDCFVFFFLRKRQRING